LPVYKGGIVPLSEYAQRPYDRDILVRVIVPKEQAAFCYQSVRNSQTDFPVLTCAAAKTAGGFRVAIGARPGKAVLYTLQPNAAETPELTAARFAAEPGTWSEHRKSQNGCKCCRPRWQGCAAAHPQCGAQIPAQHPPCRH